MSFHIYPFRTFPCRIFQKVLTAFSQEKLKVMSSYVPIKLAYEVTEPEKRTNPNDIIFIHGLSHSNIAWRRLTKKFADHTGRRTYALDMRNHGDSEWSEDFSTDIMVKDVLHFMDEKDIKQAVLIGQSMGAKISMELALEQPERVEKIVLEDLSPGRLPESIHAMIGGMLALMIKATENIPPEASYQEAHDVIYDFIFGNLPQDVREIPNLIKADRESFEIPLIKRGGRYALKSNLNFLQKWVQKPDSIRASEGLCMKPALFIYGTLSPVKVNEDEDLIMKLFPNAKMHPMEGAMHDVHNEFADEFCRVIFEFLSKS